MYKCLAWKRHFPNLTRVGLIACDLRFKALPNQQFKFLMSKVHTLMADNDCGSTPLNSSDFRFLHQNCPNLTVLDFHMASPNQELSWISLGMLVEKLHHLKVLLVETGDQEIQTSTRESCLHFFNSVAHSPSEIEHLSLRRSWLSMEMFEHLIAMKGAGLRSFRVNIYSRGHLVNWGCSMSTEDVVRTLDILRTRCLKLENLWFVTHWEMENHMRISADAAAGHHHILSHFGSTRMDAMKEIWNRTGRNFCYFLFRDRIYEEYSGVPTDVA
eukprot:gb/GEZJ01000475.1/.p1 GENE.gb/GEZJ01000475.1/~~gb/GEZJ01000475.1/.p1  ORF type:complete len:287 (-),score=15.36 gb/GEZJ01000475.1/:788-1600(-)